MSKRNLLKSSLLGYFSNTTVHGFAYLATNLTSRLEKVLWILIILIGLSCASYLINVAFGRWSSNPTDTTLQTFAYPADKIQVPTITICHNQIPDRNVLVRTVLNQLQYGCMLKPGPGQTDLAFDFVYEDWFDVITIWPEDSDDEYDSDEIHISSNPMYNPAMDKVSSRFKSIYTKNLTAATLSLVADTITNLSARKASCSIRQKRLQDDVAKLFEIPDFRQYHFSLGVPKYADYYWPFVVANELSLHFNDTYADIDAVIRVIIENRSYGVQTKLRPHIFKKKALLNWTKKNGQKYFQRDVLHLHDSEEENAIDLIKQTEIKSCRSLVGRRLQRCQNMKLLELLQFRGRAYVNLGNVIQHFKFGYENSLNGPYKRSQEYNPEIIKTFHKFMNKIEANVVSAWNVKPSTANLFDIPVLLSPHNHSVEPEMRFSDLSLELPKNVYWPTYEKLIDLMQNETENPCKDMVTFGLDGWINDYHGLIDCIHKNDLLQTLINKELSPEYIMPLMRYSNLLVNTAIGSENRFAGLRKSMSGLKDGYDLLKNKENKAYNQFTKDISRTEAILKCSMVQSTLNSVGTQSSSVVSCIPYFKHMPTHLGICSSLNPAKLVSVFNLKGNIHSYWKEFAKHYHFQKSEVMNNDINGLQHGIIVILDLKSRLFEGSYTGQDSTHFKLSINQENKFFDMSSNPLKIMPNTHNIIKISASKYEATSDYRRLPMGDRKCRFADEIPSNFSTDSMNQYTYEGCQFQCGLQSSIKTCGCRPWDMPPLGDNKDANICIGTKLQCFYDNLQESIHRATCNCEKNCEWTQFDPTFVTYNMDKQLTCQNRDILKLLIQDVSDPEDSFKYRNDYLVSTGKYFHHFSPVKIHSEQMEYCFKAATQDLASLHFEVLEQELPNYSRDISYTFFEQLATLGGTIGLFTGFSLISMVEVAFWIIRTAIQMCKREQTTPAVDTEGQQENNEEFETEVQDLVEREEYGTELTEIKTYIP